MYKKGDGHVEVLTASVRNMDHFLYALNLGSDIITAPYAILKEWGDRGLPVPDANYRYDAKGLKPILYKEIDLSKSWQDYDIAHELTLKGMGRFSEDWNSLIG
jgi:transaldolase